MSVEQGNAGCQDRDLTMIQFEHSLIPCLKKKRISSPVPRRTGLFYWPFPGRGIQPQMACSGAETQVCGGLGRRAEPIPSE